MYIKDSLEIPLGKYRVTMLKLSLCITILILTLKGVSLERDIYWRDYNGYIPDDAVPAGHGLYIGQSIHAGYLTPGTIFPKTGKFVMEYYGKIEKTKDVKIMCSKDPLRLNWEHIDVASLPDGLLERAVEGGYENERRWYIGRTFHQNEWRIGKVDFSGLKSLLVWNNDGTLHRAYIFEVLTYL